MNITDAYRKMGFSEGDNVSSKTISSNFRARSRECHPDLFPGDASKVRIFQELVSARDALNAAVSKGGSFIVPGAQKASQRSGFSFFQDIANDLANSRRGERRQWENPFSDIRRPREQPRSEQSSKSEQTNKGSKYILDAPAKAFFTVPVPYDTVVGSLLKIPVRSQNLFTPKNRCTVCAGYGVVKNASGSHVVCGQCHGYGGDLKKATGKPLSYIFVEAPQISAAGHHFQIQEATRGYGVFLSPSFPKGVWTQGNDLHIRKVVGKRKKMTVSLWGGRKVQVTIPENMPITGTVRRIPGGGADGGDAYVHFSVVS